MGLLANRPRDLSVATLIVGSIATGAAAVAAYFFAESIPVLAALLIALTGLVLTLTLDHRVKLAETERLLRAQDTAALEREAIEKLAKQDDVFQKKYDELRKEIGDLALGTYRVRTLTSLYQDDIRSIERLKAGEALLSTCPVNPASVVDAQRQLSDPAYRESMRAHVAAANRGVNVTRIYLIKDLAFYGNQAIRSHLRDVSAEDIDVRVILRNETLLEGSFDFLVFGLHKVSVGIAEPGAGTVSGGTVYTDTSTVRTHIDEYAKLKVNSRSCSDLDQLLQLGNQTEG